MNRITMLVVCALALALCAGPAFAATAVTTPPADTLKVDYFANANTAGAPDGTVRITNPARLLATFAPASSCLTLTRN